jgi:tRNA(Phe) wybutosine-synthesizing methylase Tyw3
MESDLRKSSESNTIAKNYDEVYIKNFHILKSQQDFITDASRKSSIDVRIREIVDSINDSENYFTTSSCSGRFIVFSQVNIFLFFRLSILHRHALSNYKK